MDKLIFLVDDTNSVLALGASVLEAEFLVLTMSSAAKMFSILEKKQPDMIILDVEMPDMNGFEACAKLRDNLAWKNIPVLFLTGYIDEEIQSRAAELDALDVICKSEIGSGLLERVRGSFDAIATQ